MPRRLLNRFAMVGTLAMLAIGALQLSSARSQVGGMVAAVGRLHTGTILAALALSSLAALLSGVAWWRLLQRLGNRVPYRGALAAYLSAGIAGYLVNAVGPVVGSSLSLRRHGVSPGRAALLTFIANAVGFCGVLVWAPIGLLLLARIGIDPSVPVINKLDLGAAAAALAGMAVAMVLVLHALATTAGSGRHWLERFGEHLPVGDAVQDSSLRVRDLLALVPWTAASWIAGVVSLYLILAALSPGAGIGLGLVIGAAALASTLGSLAVVVPEGIGVREGVLAAVLVHATTLPLADCVAASLALRALDPLTKLGLLGLVTLTANAGGMARRLNLVVTGASGMPRFAVQRALAIERAAVVLYRAGATRVARVGWLPATALGVGLATAARLPQLGALRLVGIDF